MVTTHLLIRQNTFLFDLPFTAVSYVWRIVGAIFYPTTKLEPEYSTKGLVANTLARYGRTRAAFASHVTQYTWDRNLYMIMSRYVWYNELQLAT